VPGSGLDAVLLTDVSDLVNTTAALSMVCRRFDEAQSLAKMGWWEYDHASDAVIWSPTLHRLLGVEPGSMDSCAQTLLDFVHPDDVDLILAPSPGGRRAAGRRTADRPAERRGALGAHRRGGPSVGYRGHRADHRLRP
jgi:PAS domain-containing protein